MAEKIEMFAGWDWDSSVIVGREMNQHLPNKCTVVVHDDKAERVFTESEVAPLLEAAKVIGQKLYHPSASVNALDAEALRRALNALGVSLDPA
jgi:hypothetical protein